MITAIVRFKLPANIDAAKAAELFRGSAPKYDGLKGLVRKYYLFDAESRTGGGCYLWESREAAERVYNAEWRKMIADRYGAAPEISFYETPVIVDNSQGKATLDAADSSGSSMPFRIVNRNENHRRARARNSDLRRI
jgi:hypothetical protein